MNGKQASPAMVASLVIPVGVGIIVSAIVSDAKWFFIGLGIMLIMVPIANAVEKRNGR